MPNTKSVFKVAVVQSPPVFLDAAATAEKLAKIISEAATNGAGLVVFPEAFIPAYPDWIWVVPAAKKQILNTLYTRLWENAVTIPDKTLDVVCKAAKSAQAHVVIGINERNAESSGTSLFNTIVYINDKGDIIGRHRKLVPTGGERLIWSQGDGSTLGAFDTTLGRLGGLICWENYMPLARMTMYAQGVQIYLAPTWDAGDVWLAGMRHIAKEGGTFVVSSCMALRKSDIPDDYEFKSMYSADKEWINIGNSCIVNPRGQFVAGPVSKSQDVIYGEIDLGEIPANKWILDTAGHYARPDVFTLTVDRTPRRDVSDKS